VFHLFEVSRSPLRECGKTKLAGRLLCLRTTSISPTNAAKLWMPRARRINGLGYLECAQRLETLLLLDDARLSYFADAEPEEDTYDRFVPAVRRREW
jgi:hypothetical protein